MVESRLFQAFTWLLGNAPHAAERRSVWRPQRSEQPQLLWIRNGRYPTRWVYSCVEVEVGSCRNHATASSLLLKIAIVRFSTLSA